MTKKVYRLPGQFEKVRGGRRKIIFLATLIVAAIAVIIIYALSDSRSLSQQRSDPDVSTSAAPKANSVEGRYLFSGTIVLGRGVEQQAQVAGGVNYAQPFQQFTSFSPEQYDGWFADLECPVTTNVVTFRQSVENSQFNCRPEWLPELTKYLKFLNLANNHTFDMGASGFAETQKTLEDAGVQTVGNYFPSVKKDICEVMALPTKVAKADGKFETATLPVAFCAVHYFVSKPQPGEMEVLERYAKIMPVFGFMQVGAEYFPTADQYQTEIGRRLIDLGSEFVIGNSPHWVQNSEVYKDKLIVYSTGNFIFDQLDGETNRGLNMDVTFKTSYDANVAKWLELGPSCTKRGDDCLDQAEKAGLKKIKLSYKFAPVGSSGGYKNLTRRADPAVQAGIEERLNWAQSRGQLEAAAKR